MNKVDDDAAKGRAQLAQRMRATIAQATSKIEQEVSSDPLPLHACETEPLNNLTSSETLPSSDLISSDMLLSSEITSPDSLLSSDVISSELKLSSDSLLCNLSKNTNSDTLPSSILLPDDPLLSSDTLPERSRNIFGELISDNLFLPVLDAGIYNLLSGDNASASMLFYWAFSKQKRSVLAITYSQVSRELHYARSRTSRTIDRIRESALFNVRATPKGVFIDLKNLINTVTNNYPQSDQESGSDLQLGSSSSFLNNKEPTNQISSGSLLIWNNINADELHIIADLISFYGFSAKEITPKLLELMAERFKNSGMESIAYNLAYAATNNKRIASPIGYLLKTLAEDYGSTSLSLEARETSDRLVETLRIVRSKKLDEYGVTDFRRFLYHLGRPIPEGFSRVECEKVLNDRLAVSDELMEKIKKITGRSERKKFPFTAYQN
jgi:hypothetical protein